MLYALLMAALAHLSGGGFGAHVLNKKGDLDENGKDKGGVMPFNLSMLPEIFFGMVFGVALYLAFDSMVAGVVAAAWSYGWMESGHGTVLQWGRHPHHATGARRQRLSLVVDILSDLLGFERGDVNYCRLFMAVKGFLIGIPVGGAILAVLWPLGYEIGNRLRGKTPHWFAFCELLSGAGAGLAIAIFLAVMGG